MEFNQKLQELRKQKGLTQEELAGALFVSRTAVSKWESGRGYPGIDSLKAISNYFDVSIDELLSGNELLSIADRDSKQKKAQLLRTVFGLLDVGLVLLLLLPVFAQRQNGIITEVPLLSLTSVSPYLKTAYILFVSLSAVLGAVTLSLHGSQNKKLHRGFIAASLALSFSGVLLFIVSSQVYPAALLFTFFAIKVLLLIKRK